MDGFRYSLHRITVLSTLAVAFAVIASFALAPSVASARDSSDAGVSIGREAIPGKRLEIFDPYDDTDHDFQGGDDDDSDSGSGSGDGDGDGNRRGVAGANDDDDSGNGDSGSGEFGSGSGDSGDRQGVAGAGFDDDDSGNGDSGSGDGGSGSGDSGDGQSNGGSSVAGASVPAPQRPAWTFSDAPFQPQPPTIVVIPSGTNNQPSTTTTQPGSVAGASDQYMPAQPQQPGAVAGAASGYPGAALDPMTGQPMPVPADTGNAGLAEQGTAPVFVALAVAALAGFAAYIRRTVRVS